MPLIGNSDLDAYPLSLGGNTFGWTTDEERSFGVLDAYAAEPGAVTVDVLRRYDLILPTGTQLVGQEIEHLLALLGLPAVTSLRSSSYGFIREMLHATDLISVMPRLMMVGDLLRGTLKVVPLPIPAPDRPAGVILPRDRPLSNAGRSFVQCLRAFVAEIAERGVAGIASRYSDAERSNTTHSDDQG